VPTPPVLPLQAAGPLLDLVRSAAADRSLWAPAVRFDATRRWWARVLTTSDVELWLLTWLPGQDTELHDHGGSAAAFAVVTGALEEVRADADGRLARSVHAAGSAVWVAPGAVHDVAHAGAGPAVSLHAYAPRLQRMTYWTAGPSGLRRGRTVVTDQPELEAAS